MLRELISVLAFSREPGFRLILHQNGTLYIRNAQMKSLGNCGVACCTNSAIVTVDYIVHWEFGNFQWLNWLDGGLVFMLAGQTLCFFEKGSAIAPIPPLELESFLLIRKRG